MLLNITLSLYVGSVEQHLNRIEKGHIHTVDNHVFTCTAYFNEQSLQAYSRYRCREKAVCSTKHRFEGTLLTERLTTLPLTCLLPLTEHPVCYTQCADGQENLNVLHFAYFIPESILTEHFPIQIKIPVWEG